MDINVLHALIQSLISRKGDRRSLTFLATAGPMATERLPAAAGAEAAYTAIRLAFIQDGTLVIKALVSTRPDALLAHTGRTISPSINLGLGRLPSRFNSDATELMTYVLPGSALC